jgi:hypothetical protein
MPIGNAFIGYKVYVYATAYDILSASANTSTIIFSFPNPTFSALNYARDKLQYNELVDYTVATVNSISITMNRNFMVDCSNTSESFCNNELNRYACKEISQMCGSCLDGYVGVSGPENTPCVLSTNLTKYTRNERCDANTDCNQPSYCSNDGICVLSQRQCPSSLRNKDCSGHGSCTYEINGRLLDDPARDCTILDEECNVYCNCQEGYGGKDCSIDIATLQQRL